MRIRNIRTIGGIAVLLTMLIGGSNSTSANVQLSNPTTQLQGRSLTSSGAQQPDVTDPPAWHNDFPHYNDIKMVSATGGWLVGDGGVIKHYADGQWRDYSSPVTTTLNAIDANASEAWIAGRNVILHLVAGNWQVQATPAPTDTNFVAVQIVAPGEAWAVGNNGNQTYFIHYQNGAWTPGPTPPEGPVAQLTCPSPTECWLVATTGYNVSDLLHYQDGSWSTIVNAISTAMLSSREGWIGYLVIAGEPPAYSLEHYLIGQGRARANPTPTTPDVCPLQKPTQPLEMYYYSGVYQVQAVAPDDNFSLRSFGSQYITLPYCDLYIPTTGGGMLFHNETQLSDVLLSHISALADNDVWATTSDGLSVYHWDGTQLNQIMLGISGGKVQSFGANDIWAGGSSQSWLVLNNAPLYHYDGADWMTSITATTFAFASPTDGWAYVSQWSPSHASIFKHYDGNSWSVHQDISTNNYIIAMTMITTTQGWAVGNQFNDPNSHPLVVSYDGQSWQSAIFSDTFGQLIAVSFDTPTDGWAVGATTTGGIQNGPLAYHYSNGTWQRVSLPIGGYAAYAVAALAPDDVWLSVSPDVPYHRLNSQLLHWDGIQWQIIRVPVQEVYSITMLSPTEGWAGGENYDSNGIQYRAPLLHYIRNTWQTADNPGQLINSISFIGSNGYAVGDSFLRYYPLCRDYYADIPANYYVHDAIISLSCRGITNGAGTHIFSPDANATRDQFAKMITLARGWPLTTPTQPTFSDVPASYPFYSYIETAYANGALSGASTQQCQAHGLTSPCFLPHDAITRAQIAIITVRAFGWAIDTSGGPHFSDVPPSNYAYAGVETAYHHGVVNGIGGGLFAPNQSVTRSQLAAILYRALTNP